MGRGLVGILLLVTVVPVVEDDREMPWSWTLVGPFGGEARRLAVDPRDPHRIFVGTCDGQLYLSEDGGGELAGALGIPSSGILRLRHPGGCGGFSNDLRRGVVRVR